jgi:Arc/MetJ-type ribon-helix-helix transcriptional regulator
MKRMTVQIPVRIPSEDARALDDAVARGRFESRSDAIRDAVARLLRELRDEEIHAEYERAYGAVPQVEATDGLRLLADRVALEEPTEPL